MHNGAESLVKSRENAVMASAKEQAVKSCSLSALVLGVAGQASELLQILRTHTCTINNRVATKLPILM